MPFPPLTTTPPLGVLGTDPLGTSPLGSALPLFGLVNVSAVNSTLVRVEFTDLLDFSFGLTLNPANYSFSGGLTVLAVVAESAGTLLIATTEQDAVLYTLTVGAAQSYVGATLDSSLSQDTFTGIALDPSFLASGIAKRTIRLSFGTVMADSAELVAPASYTVTDLNGDPVSILSVAKATAANPMGVVLTLSSDLQTTESYRVTVSGTVLTLGGLSILPSTMLFTWVETTKDFAVPIAAFGGEVQGGPFGEHGGLVFFSPALMTPTANSIIQVEQVDVCTTAYDSYHFPQLVDPKPLYTFLKGLPPSTLDAGSVLWAPWPRLNEAQTNLSQRLVEAPVPPPEDSLAVATFTEAYDLTKVSLLNSIAWKLFDNAGEPPTYFKTAVNTAPIGPGGVVTVTLEPAEGYGYDALVITDSVVVA